MRAMPNFDSRRGLRCAHGGPRPAKLRSVRLGSSSHAPLITLLSFALAVGAAVGPAEGTALAQRPATATKAKAKDKDKKETAPSDAAPPAGEEEQTDEQKKAEEEQKAKEAKEAEEKKELDLSKESPKAIYFSGDIAFTRSDLGGISDNTGLDRTVANGFLYGVSAGLRLKDFRFGGRWRVHDTTEFTLWTLALSAGYGLPLRPVSPIFSAHVGYVFDQHVEEALFRRSLPDGVILPPDVDVKGILAGVDINASYWITKFLRLGAFIGADLMFLSREKVAIPQSIFGPDPAVANQPLYAGSGSSIGLNMNLGLRGAFDIAFQ